jgi:NADH dehydrogenase FAD-containing subunit
MQKVTRDAKDLVIVGGGAVGVELAADAKTKYPEKNVSLIHSRSTLLNSFGPKLHDYVMEEFRKLEINVHLGERAPEGVQNEKALDFTLKSGKVVTFDLLVGQVVKR